MKYIALILAIVAAPLYAGSGDKVTGDGYWTNGSGTEMYASWIGIDGKKGPKGSLLQRKLSGTPGEYVVDDIDYVVVGESTACVSGVVTQATGLWTHFLGSRAWVVMQDGGSGTDERGGDKYRAAISNSSVANPPSFCVYPNFASNQPFSGGNVQIN